MPEHMPEIDDDDAALLAGVVDAAEANAEFLNTLLTRHAEWPSWLREHYSTLWDAIDDAVRMSRCVWCEKGVGVTRGPDGPLCAGCARKVAA